MKKILFTLFILSQFFLSSTSFADGVCTATNETELLTDLGFASGCTEINITEDITLSDYVSVTLDNIEIYSTGNKTLGGPLETKPVLYISSTGVTIHDLKINNTGNAVGNTYGIMISGITTTTVYDVDFVACGDSCINIDNGASTTNFFQNTFRNFNAETAITYTGGTHTGPSFTDKTAAIADDVSGWTLNLTTPSGAAGYVEPYVMSGNDLIPAVTVTALNQLTPGTGDTAISMSFSHLPNGQFYALFTGSAAESNTSKFSAGYSVDWDSAPLVNFSWGTKTACNVTWFTQSGGQWTGNSDTDAKTNEEEDTNKNCTVDGTESDPVTLEYAPTAPVPTYPTTGLQDVDTSLSFTWTASTDADSDTITYSLYYCTDVDLTQCTTVSSISANVASKFDYTGNGALFLIGSIIVGSTFSRRRKLMILIVGLSLLGPMVFSCGGSSGSTTSTTPSYSVTGLSKETTYYWKVRAIDQHGWYTDSSSYSFKTKSN